MNKFIRFYNQNKKTIFKYIGIVLVAYAVLQIINLYYKNTISEESYNNLSNVTYENSTVLNNNTIVENNKTTTEKFIEYCENDKIEDAYKMLSSESKEKIKYNTIEKFKSNFIDNFLKTGSKYYVTKIKDESNTYVIEIYNEDILSTGNASSIGKKYIKESNNKITLLDFI